MRDAPGMSLRKRMESCPAHREALEGFSLSEIEVRLATPEAHLRVSQGGPLAGGGPWNCRVRAPGALCASRPLYPFRAPQTG